MNEADARDFFNTLPVTERLRLLREIIGDIEHKLRPDDSPALELFEAGELPDLPLPFNLVREENGNRISQGGDSADDFNPHKRHPNNAENIHGLRLSDAVDHLRDLLKKHGYVQGMPSPGDLARMVREAELAARRKGRRSAWAEWVARDQATLDRPASHDWENWVTKEDEETEIRNAAE